MTDMPNSDAPSEDAADQAPEAPKADSTDADATSEPTEGGADAEASGHESAESEPAADATAPASNSLAVYLLRHADAGDPMAWKGDDWDRPLSRKGRRQARRLGSLLDDLGVRPDAIVSSPRLRAIDTAKRVGRRVRVTPMTDDRLAGGFSGEAF